MDPSSIRSWGDSMRWTLPASALLAAMLFLAPGYAQAQGCASTPAAPRANLHAADLDAAGIRVGLALGSGSLHGLAHVGVLQAIEESGLPVHVVAGTSAGALVGSLWASGLTAAQIAVIAQSRQLENLSSFAPSSAGLMTNEPLRARLQAAFGERPIESWPMRFGAVATNMDNGHRRIIMSGSGALAVQASSASPVIFGPLVLDGERLADGALVEPVPVDAARAMGANFVIAVDVAYRPYEEPAEGIVQSGFQAMNILLNSLGAAQVREADLVIRLDVHETLMRCGPQAVIALGRDAARRALPEVARLARTRTARAGR
jgi:NTE family protein